VTPAGRYPPGVPVLYRARWSFVGQTRSLVRTGHLMARWAESAAALLAPELDWDAAVQEHSDYELDGRWETSHVVRLHAWTSAGGTSRLAAGGREKRIGGSGRVVLRAVGPPRFLDVDAHCDVTHWDVRCGGVERAAVDAMMRILEEEVGAAATIGAEEVTGYQRGPRRVARTEDEGDALLWVGDLADVGLPARSRAVDGGYEVHVQASEIATLEELERARVTLGEVLAEAGSDDWAERAERLLVQVGAYSERPL